MYQRIGQAAYKKDLTNIVAILQALGDPHRQFTSIHVGGTNGKGSVSNMLASVCQEAGYTTGLYTSPHLEDFRERIRVNGHLCDEWFVTNFAERIRPVIEEISPSFFEITVAMAFDYFAYREVDIAIIEVGLGGRLDSTNVITPALSVITNISFDHMHMLGDTLPLIAFEKAGIIKPGIPVVIGEYLSDTLPVFERKAAETASPLYPAQENVQVDWLEENVDGMRIQVSYLGQLAYPEMTCALSGNYQLKNIATAIQAVEVMRMQGIEIPDEAVYDGLRYVVRNTGFAGRWHVLQRSPLVLADCAHNSGGLALLFEQVHNLAYNALHIVTGTVNDKDLQASLACFPAEAHYYFSRPNIPRGLDAEALQQLAATFGMLGNTWPSVADALREAYRKAGSDDLILICGSIFVVAEALPAFRQLSSEAHNTTL